jgi:alginate O-acetyltransferase complex protein AlgJ
MGVTTKPEELTREQQAMREIGVTDISPHLAMLMTLAFCGLIAAVPLWEEFAPRRSGAMARHWSVAGLVPTWSEVQGIATSSSPWQATLKVNARILREIKTYEDGLKADSTIVQALVPLMQVPISGWLKGGNEDAYIGRDGWLFYRKDIDSLTGHGFLDPAVLARRAAGGSELVAPPQPDPIKAIVDFRDQLASRGIDLIVMPVPIKPTVYADRFSSRYESRAGVVQNPSFEAFLERLEREGVTCLDVAPLLAEAKSAAPDRPLYLKTDTHWTPEGMELAATALARLARSTVPLPPATDRFSAIATEITALGDVAGMLKLPPERRIFPPETVTIRQVQSGDAVLRPDRKAEVLFLGDSFANIYSLAPMGWGDAAGLVEHLALALGLPVDAITRNDAGSFATREMLAKELQRGNDRLAGKKLVIWEFAARELAWGDWKILPMTLGERRETGMYVPPAGTTKVVRGVVRAVSPAPKPGSVPYKDHIVMVHVEGLESADDPAADGQEAVVFAWSMRDNVQTPPAAWRPGDGVNLRLRRWAAVADEYEAINRSELDDEAAMLAEPTWGELEP